jgi:hypothetical protein
VFGGASLLVTWTGGADMYLQYYLFRNASTDPPSFYTQMYTQRSPSYPSAVARDNSTIAFIDTTVLPGVNYTYFWSVKAVNYGPTYTFSSSYNSIFAQVLKR